jgi:hypothetical protein
MKQGIAAECAEREGRQKLEYVVKAAFVQHGNNGHAENAKHAYNYYRNQSVDVNFERANIFRLSKTF